MENILETGFYTGNLVNCLLTSTGEMVFRGKPKEDQVRKFYINNGKYRGNYLECSFSLSSPNVYEVSVIGKGGLPIDKVILPLIDLEKTIKL